MTVTCFGELLIRLTPPDRRLLAQADMLGLTVGGAEANVAVALASLGQTARFCGLVSDNALGDRAVAELRSAGVDTSSLARAAGRMGLYFLETGAGPRPSTITYDRAGSAFAEAEAGTIDFAAALEGARLFHTGGITPALGAKGVELARVANRTAVAAGVPICFDGNYRGALWSAWDSDPRAVLSELVGDATILIGNHRDISLLLGEAREEIRTVRTHAGACIIGRDHAWRGARRGVGAIIGRRDRRDRRARGGPHGAGIAGADRRDLGRRDGRSLVHRHQ